MLIVQIEGKSTTISGMILVIICKCLVKLHQSELRVMSCIKTLITEYRLWNGIALYQKAQHQ